MNNGISKTVLVLSIIISLLVGAIGGFFIGENNVQKKLENSRVYTSESNNSNDSNNNIANNQNNSSNSSDENVSNIDFSAIKIGNSDFTVDTYYTDTETKELVSKVINQKIPELTWSDAEGNEHSTNELDDEYIVEFFMTTCTYCNQAIPEVDSFRESHPEMKVVSLAFDNGDLTNFNTKGDNAYYLGNMNTSADVVEFTNNIPYVPAMIYVKGGEVKLVTFGGPTKTEIEDAMSIAFGD